MKIKSILTLIVCLLAILTVGLLFAGCKANVNVDADGDTDGIVSKTENNLGVSSNAGNNGGNGNNTTNPGTSSKVFQVGEDVVIDMDWDDEDVTPNTSSKNNTTGTSSKKQNGGSTATSSKKPTSSTTSTSSQTPNSSTNQGGNSSDDGWTGFYPITPYNPNK